MLAVVATSIDYFIPTTNRAYFDYFFIHLIAIKMRLWLH